LAAAALQQGCVQELAVVIAPKLMGGSLARTPLGDLGFTAMDQVVPLSLASAQHLGEDLLLQAQLGLDRIG
jgi:diaminohydroxyphosphoribosylaminopyrimidine deaminase/5-amino-6-(5-phosphoribosylamino)uracil reductase